MGFLPFFKEGDQRMIEIKEIFEIADEKYNYTAGYYTSNKWIDNNTIVLARSENPAISGKEAPVELVKISLETGEKTVLCDNVSGFTGFVVHGKFLYYTTGKEIRRVDTETGENNLIYKDSFFADDDSIRFCMPEITADGKYLSIFTHSPKKPAFLVVDIEKGTAKILFEKRFSDPFPIANHGMICPTNPEIMFFAHEGDTRYITNRLWIYNDITGEMYNTAKQNLDENGNLGDCFGHESWAPDGKGLYFVKYPISPVPPKGICYVDIETREIKLLYSGFPYWHVGVSSDNKYLLADTVIDYKTTDVVVIDTTDGSETRIDTVKVENHPRHAHPQMSPDNKTVIYTAVSENGKSSVKVTKLK